MIPFKSKSIRAWLWSSSYSKVIMTLQKISDILKKTGLNLKTWQKIHLFLDTLQVLRLEIWKFKCWKACDLTLLILYVLKVWNFLPSCRFFFTIQKWYPCPCNSIKNLGIMEAKSESVSHLYISKDERKIFVLQASKCLIINLITGFTFKNHFISDQIMQCQLFRCSLRNIWASYE